MSTYGAFGRKMSQATADREAARGASGRGGTRRRAARPARAAPRRAPGSRRGRRTCSSRTRSCRTASRTPHHADAATSAPSQTEHATACPQGRPAGAGWRVAAPRPKTAVRQRSVRARRAASSRSGLRPLRDGCSTRASPRGPIVASTSLRLLRAAGRRLLGGRLPGGCGGLSGLPRHCCPFRSSLGAKGHLQPASSDSCPTCEPLDASTVGRRGARRASRSVAAPARPASRRGSRRSRSSRARRPGSRAAR